MTLKTRVEGRVTEVGWEQHTRTIIRTYATIKIKISSTQRQDVADKQLEQLRKILGKKVVIFPEE